MALVKLLLFLTTASCAYGLSAAATIPVPPDAADAYCQPVNPDYEICRTDMGHEWRCHIGQGYWHCDLTPMNDALTWRF